MDEEYIGQKVNTFITSERQGMDYHVSYRVVEERSKDLKAWEKREVMMKAVGPSFASALTECYRSIYLYLDSIDGSLFSDKATNQYSGHTLN